MNERLRNEKLLILDKGLSLKERSKQHVLSLKRRSQEFTDCL